MQLLVPQPKAYHDNVLLKEKPSKYFYDGYFRDRQTDSMILRHYLRRQS